MNELNAKQIAGTAIGLSEDLMGSEIVKPIAIPGIHDSFYPFFLKLIGGKEHNSICILDAGAGHGALSKKLYEDNFHVFACDLFPEYFNFKEIDCNKADLSGKLPYENNTFDFIIAIEVAEHIFDHEVFFKECNRVLKDKGKLVISTPNILSLKSRIRFLLSGFFYSYEPINKNKSDGLQHVSSRTLDQLTYVGEKNNFRLHTLAVDKYQRSSLLFLWIYPFLIFFSILLKINPKIHNTLDLLLGRILFIVFQKK